MRLRIVADLLRGRFNHVHAALWFTHNLSSLQSNGD